MTDAWRVEITRPAARDIKRLDPPIQVRIDAALWHPRPDRLTLTRPTATAETLTGRLVRPLIPPFSGIIALETRLAVPRAGTQTRPDLVC